MIYAQIKKVTLDFSCFAYVQISALMHFQFSLLPEISFRSGRRNNFYQACLFQVAALPHGFMLSNTENSSVSSPGSS